MIIILEGSDKVGKTTLSKLLEARYESEVVHFSAPKKDPYREYMDFLDKADTKKNYVLDRFHVGEIVYGELYRGKSKVSVDQLWYLDLRLQAHQALLVHCFTDSDTVKRKFIEDNEESSRLEDVETILSMFKDAVTVSCLQRFDYNWQDPKSTPKLFERIDFLIKEPRLENEEVKNYLGSPEPKVLFLGDTKNKRLRGKGIFESRSGKFLIKCLERVGILNGKAIGITNSDLITKEFYEKIGKPKIVCLGKKSLLRTTKMKLSAYHIQHPQWMFRFGGQNALNSYCKILKEIK